MLDTRQAWWASGLLEVRDARRQAYARSSSPTPRVPRRTYCQPGGSGDGCPNRRAAGRRADCRECPGSCIRLRPKRQDPRREQCGVPAPRPPPRRGPRTVALPVPERDRGERVRGRGARGHRPRCHAQCPAPPAERLRRYDPDQPERRGAARSSRKGDWGHRRAARHARARQGASLRRKSHQERA